MSESLCLVVVLLVPLAAAGLALIHQGLGRSRSAGHTMLGTLCAMALAAVAFVLVGSAWAGFAGGSAHLIPVGGGRTLDWLGAEPFFSDGLWHGSADAVHGTLLLCLQVFAVGLVAIIPISAGGDRWRLGGICCASIFAGALAYPLISHWVWAGGWLAQLGSAFGLSAFVDPGGAAVVQVPSGLAALSVAWIAGLRQGKYAGGVATAIPGHNIVLVLFGCVLALVGFTALELAASELVYGAPLQQLVWTAINAMLSAGCGLLAAVLTTRLRYRKPDASISANGWVAGLVAGSAGCGTLSPGQAVFIAVIAGGLVTWLVEKLEMDLMIDDPGGAISVHAGAGIWGLLAFGVMGPTGLEGRAIHLLVEFIGIGTLLGCLLPLLHVANVLLDRIVPYRVDRDGDWQGMDIRELGSGRVP